MTSPHSPPLSHLLFEVSTQQWVPYPETLGWELLARAAGYSEAEKMRLIRSFAAVALRRQGLYWSEVLEARLDEVRASDRTYVLASFDDFLDGLCSSISRAKPTTRRRAIASRE